MTALLFLALFLSGSYAQSTVKLEGWVYDKDDGSPIAGVSLVLNNTGISALTDNFGCYRFENIPPGIYNLKITAAGYDDEIIKEIEIVPDISRRLVIRLSKKTYRVNDITVKGRRLPISTDRVTVIEKEQIVTSDARDLAELLDKVEGVFVQRTSPSSGRAQVKIRGGSAKQVLVLLDGQKMNLSGSGEVDFGSIPVNMIERVEIHKGGASAEFGPDAFAGVINIITRPRTLLKDFTATSHMIRGKWQEDSYGLYLENPAPLDKFSTRFTYEQRSAEADFDYAYTVSGGGGSSDSTINGTRVNNDMASDNYFVSGLYQPSNRLKLSFSGQAYVNENGLPGPPTNQNEFARFKDERLSLTAAVDYERSPRNLYRLETGYSRYVQRFTDLESRTNNFDSRYVNDIFTVHARHDRSLWKDNRIKTGTELRRDILYHDDFYIPRWSMGRTVRDSWGIYLIDEQRFNISPMRIFDEIALDFALRYDNTFTDKDSTSWQDATTAHRAVEWSPKTGLALSKQTPHIDYVFRAGWGKSYRLPAINSLWKNDLLARGNPGLKPERAKHLEAGIEVAGDYGVLNLSGGLTFYSSDITDLIVWVQGYGSSWRPENLASAETSGHEEFIELSLFDKIFSFKYQNTITDALNKTEGLNEYDKQLVFTPRYLTGFSATVDYGGVEISYSVRLVDKVYILKANTKYYGAYRLDDLKINFSRDISAHWTVSVDYNLYNILDENYVLISQYPMPRRQWQLGISLNYHINKNG
ncbi:MAG: TonB-dependent receptor [Candidatus Zixiibacteriota bacterium]